VSLEENKSVILRLVEVINNRNLSSLGELVSSDFVYHTFQIKGSEVMKKAIEEEIIGFPDFHVTIEDIAAEGDKVWFRVTETGTHKGEYRD
jgi:predicted ester cyclase